MKATAIGSDETVYIDLLESRRLEAITAAMRKALVSSRRDFWPSTVQGAEALRGGTSARTLEPRPVIVPLERLGGEQGYSGASVFIAYYMDASGTFLPSKPVVVKVGSREVLADELQNARSWPSHFSGEDSRFAFPLYYFGPKSRGSNTAVLIAPFSSEGALNAEQTGWHFHLSDLWQLLLGDRSRNHPLLRLLGDLYGLLHGVHRDGRVVCGRRDFQYHLEYDRYLHGLHRSQEGITATLFGSGETTRMFGMDWPNPRTVVSRVFSLSAFEGAAGPVHGDLHPKNVVLDKHSRPHVIDFGWAQPSGHVIRDYVLMDVNLRAITLPSHVSFTDTLALAQHLSPGDGSPDVAPVIQERLRLIRDGIWSHVRDHGTVRSWETEYVIPLFLVAYGLLRHLDQARNQVALLLSVLCAGARVVRALGDE